MTTRTVAALRGAALGTVLGLGALALVHCPPRLPQTMAPADGGYSGCMASCPSPPEGCERSSIDPGYCTPDSGCTSPPPACHYQPKPGFEVECPPQLAGRCIPPT
jgi:hypothetical protein